MPLLGVRKWPLDYFWNRVLKRGEDICGSLLGLVLSAPVIAVAAAVHQAHLARARSSTARSAAGRRGALFTLYKLRTMKDDAEEQTGPGLDTRGRPAAARGSAPSCAGYNLDELPQFWNVLKGDMSLVGPRPERPHFVEQFKEDIGRYMWRHVPKPGMTGWAQVNGLRGNTSIQDRIQYDLYYLENWSLSLDFKILLKTFAARKNAY